jgi:V/A-type H+-transporting ATPase subunit D
MAGMTSPTRMELKRIKGRLQTATRGHKLLKDKVDEMIRQFIVLIKENRELRQQVEAELGEALNSFMLAKAVSGAQEIEESVLMPGAGVLLKCTTKSVMSVTVPRIEIRQTENAELYPYSFLTMTSELDMSISTLNQLLVKLLTLCEKEKTCNMLADEIEKNKRRVNALEHIMIPGFLTEIKYIRMKLDETERGALIRLMKVKSMIVKRGEQELKRYKKTAGAGVSGVNGAGAIKTEV